MDSKERLQMLYEIGLQLKADQGLDRLFCNVVTLVSSRLGSEEAALFVPDDRGIRLQKVAVSGPGRETINRLSTLELFYEHGEGLISRVFERKLPVIVNDISPDEECFSDYSVLMPSRTTRHYMGAPLLLGDEVLGVIRVLNKKAPGYSTSSRTAILAEEGFDNEDLDLLTMIATQVASAIRNASFIERNRHFENLVYKSPNPIIVLDANGMIRNFNQECESVWGMTEQQVWGQPVQEFYESPDHAREVGRALWEAEGHTIRNYPARVRDAEGCVVPIRLSASLLLDKDGSFAGSIGIFSDMRDTIRDEAKKIRAEKLAAIGQLAQTTGHDIKTDLSTILNWTDTLEGTTGATAITLEACSAIRSAISKALGKLQNMLMTANPKPPEKEIVSIRSILEVFQAGVQSETSLTRIDFILRYPPSDPLVHADVEQMRQLFAILFRNSLEAIKRAREHRNAGLIELKVEVAEHALLLTWRDDGCGMSTDTRLSAFLPFFTTKQNGSGLGLFIMKTIVETHDGRVSVEAGAGVGCCFEITLPLAFGSVHTERLL